jgi:hypothetical protein
VTEFRLLRDWQDGTIPEPGWHWLTLIPPAWLSQPATIGGSLWEACWANAGVAMLAAAMAAPKISFDTVAMISFSADALLSARRRLDYIAAKWNQK